MPVKQNANQIEANGLLPRGLAATASHGAGEVFAKAGHQHPASPATDGTVNLGSGSFRYGTVFAVTSTISTSDQREKQDIEMLDAAELRVAKAVKGLARKYRFRDAVAEKGDSARIHFGFIAQDVIAAFEAEGLDASRYGIICYDEWEETVEENTVGLDEEGRPIVERAVHHAGNRYGLRYEELYAFLIAAG